MKTKPNWVANWHKCLVNWDQHLLHQVTMEMQTECLGMLSWSPSAAACLGGEVLHRQQSLGHYRASKSTTWAGEKCLELKVSVLGFCSVAVVCQPAGDAAVCPAAVWALFMWWCCYHLIKTTKPTVPTPPVGQPGVCCCLRGMGEERGGISSIGSDHSWGICWPPSFTQLFLSPKNVSSLIIPCVPLYQGELESMS